MFTLLLQRVTDMQPAKLRLDSNLFRKDRTLSAYLTIAVRAAREAKLLHLMPGTDEEARSLIMPLLIDHTVALKTSWLRQPNGGIRGWRAFLTLLGCRERLTVEFADPTPAREPAPQQEPEVSRFRRSDRSAGVVAVRACQN